MLNLTIITSYVFSLICFILFAYLSFSQFRSASGSRQAEPEGLAGAQPQGALSDMAKLVEALSKLTDSFAKAGPLVMSLVAAIFFLLIAVIGSGFDSAVAAIAS
jgi:hypothetical protein